jgi:CTD small phosphatase-like protein 2
LDRNNSLIINENNNLNKSTDINNHYSCEQLVNIEDLIIIEEKYETIEKLIIEKNYYVLSKTCYEWFNFYFNCRLGGNLTQFFIDNKIKKTIEDSNILSLISLLIIYEFSFHQKLFELHRKLITKISSLINKNYLLICNNFLSKIKKEFLNSIWVERLRNITLNRVNNKEYYINQIDKNTDEIYETITLIISSIKNNNKIFNKKIIEIFNNYSKFSHDKIYRIFLTNILKLNNSSGSILYSNLKSSSPQINFKLKSSPIKPLTLFLDLDETLMSFVFSKENEGISRMRPYLFQFLNLVKNYYELIIFTAAKSDYADPILDVIERKKGTYFTYRLYRESCSIINNYYVKDIGKFGRDLRKCIIVDNMSQNFRLQKENGILISSFWGEDINDKALFYLGRILVSIGMEMVEKNYMIDIRDELVKYKDEILRKVSMK